ncbi:MAG: hypothetical protein GEU82_06230 [Luteitalea sp.]|nr:hypothetical protein [Luteitalea sp.]
MSGALIIAGSVTVVGQTAPRASATAAAAAPNLPRTADGRPDLQGIWNYSTLTPLERPKDLGDKAFFTAEEAAAYEKSEVVARSADRRDKTVRAVVNGTQETTDVALAYNDFWWDRGTTIVGTNRTSLIVEPANGRLPALTPEAATAARERRARIERLAEGPEDRTTGDRCIHQQRTGPPMLPGGYNNHVQIFQTPELVALAVEQIHEFRTIPMDGRPHVDPAISLWKGDSRGRWEGDTLVVDTANFNGKMAFQGSTAKMHLVERFTRVDADTLRYEFKIEDPAAFATPWSASLTMTKTEGPMFEYACHEGNYAMEGILRAARKIEKDTDAAKKGSR